MLSTHRLDALSRGVARRYHDVPGMDAADLRQEAALAILEAVAKGETREGWLVQRARHRLSAIFASAISRGTWSQTLTQTPIDDSPTAEDVAAGREFFGLLGTFSPQQASVIELGYRQGLSDSETAAALGTTALSVRVSRAKALAKLRSLVTSEPPKGH